MKKRIGTRFALVLLALLLGVTASANAQFGISVSFGPPALPVYVQPPCPGDGYMWTPGYWAWNEDYGDYYWVPGTWVMAPQPGYLWTPPWWGWENGAYLFHEGYWGLHIGFYGGINYGFGYTGDGFWGGRWDGDHFFYNRSVTNINNTYIRNVYNERIVNNYNNGAMNRTSFNGGPGGINARPNHEQQIAMRENHLAPVAAQKEHLQMARYNPQLRASVNQGRPPVAATDKPGQFRGKGVVPARNSSTPYHPQQYNTPAQRNGSMQPSNGAYRPYVHPNDLPQYQHPNAPANNPGFNQQRYQQQQDQFFTRQQQERQQLQQRQDLQHQQYQQRWNSNPQRMQQLEQTHQQQTRQLEQRQYNQYQQFHQNPSYSAQRSQPQQRGNWKR